MDFTNIGNDFNIYNMKYLKRFNESVDKSNIEEIKQTIKDILLPISDMGYEISVIDDADYLLTLFRSVSHIVTPKLMTNIMIIFLI